MANKRYLQIGTNGLPVEDNENLTLTSELAASTGATLVGVADGSLTNISGSDLQAILASIDTAIGSAGAVDSVNTLTGAVVLTGQNVDTNHTPVNYTSAGATITENLAGIDTAIASLVNGVNYKGLFDASAGDYVAISTGAEVGDLYKISVAGTIGPKTWDVGDTLLINDTYVSGTVVDANVDKIDNTESVNSVNGETGVVVLTSNDLDSDATITVATPAGTTITDDLEALDSATADALKDCDVVGYTAASNITAGDPVYKTSLTQVAPAQADMDDALEVIGIALTTVLSGAAVTVRKSGPSGAIYAGLTASQPVFLSEAGGVTQTAPTTSGSYVLRIGKATAVDAIDIETKNSAIQRA